MNVWEIVTGNSQLPIEPGNTFYDHLVNQNTGTGSGISTIIRECGDISGTIDQRVIEFGKDQQTVIYDNDQTATKQTSSGRTLSASSEKRAVSVTTGRKKGTITVGTRKVRVK